MLILYGAGYGTAKRTLGKTISYKVRTPARPDSGVPAGIDRNCGQLAVITSNGERKIL